MKVVKIIWCLMAALVLPALTPRACANNAGAVVLVNSQSARYPDYVHFLQPYLGNFGVPYAVLDISSNSIGNTLTNYALVIIGHSQLDTNNQYLTAATQTSISKAVSNGVGLVSFDNVLASNNVPLYQFEQTIFGFGYTNASGAQTVEFPPTQPQSQMHYITSLHVTNDRVALSNAVSFTTLTVAGLVLPTNVTAVATCGGAPLVTVVNYGQGRAVQWASYDWMSTTIQGPVNQLDDLVWRGFVWAARKPFVMRGMPHFVTMRIDDVTGDLENLPTSPPAFWWIHQMTNVGFKPWLALFTDDLNYASRGWPADGRLTDLSNLVASGSVTASVHAFSTSATNFFFFDHTLLTEWPDNVVSNHFALGTQFLTNAGIPSSKVVIAHFNEIGTNACAGLTNWGVQYIMDMIPPGTTAYEPPFAPWLVGGPYRLYETPQLGGSVLPFYYADWLTVPGHPELNGKFFNCYTEIRNVGVAPEWAPANGDVSGSIARGYAMLKRGFDSMTLPDIFTHEYYINPSDGPNYGHFTTNNFLAVLQGITNAIGPYQPTYVTMDYACQYVRATRTAQITAGDYSSSTRHVTATFSGSTDLPITAYYFTGTDSSITAVPATVPVFSGTSTVTMATKPALLVLADWKNRPYSTANPALTYTVSGFLGTDTVAVVHGSPGLYTAAAMSSPAGNYSIIITNVNMTASNYTLTFVNGNLAVNPLPLGVTANSESVAYGTTNPVLTASYSGFINGDTTNVLSGSPSLTTPAKVNSPVGTYPITAAQGSLWTTNYLFSFTNGTLTVTQSVLLASANNQSRPYGTTNPVLTWAFSGFVGTDTVAVVSGSPVLGTTATTSSSPGDYPISITAGSLSATNYNFAFANGALTVTPTAPAILSITGAGTTNVVITWSSISNVTYSVQYASDFLAPDWQDLPPNVTATNSTASTVDSSGNVPQRFYRVIAP